MTFPLIMLWVGALAFGFFGVLLFVAPAKMGVVGLLPASADARSEVRAMYGGLEVGIAVFLLLCIKYESAHGAGLSFLTLALGCLAAGRIIGIAIERGKVSRLIFFFAAIETITAVLCFLAMKQAL